MRTVLDLGEHGTGKTSFALTMPRPAYLFSFDQGYRTGAATEGVRAAVWEKEDRTRPTVYKEFMPKFRALMRKEGEYVWPGGTGKKEPFRSIILDGWSFLSRSIFDHFQYINSNIDKPGGYNVYGLVRSHSEDILRAVMDASEQDDITVGVTALPELVKDEDNPGVVYLGPSCVGSIKNDMGAMFDAVIFSHVDAPKKGAPPSEKPKYWVRTQTEGLERCRLRIPPQIADCLSPMEEPNFAKMKGKIDAAWKAWSAKQPAPRGAA